MTKKEKGSKCATPELVNIDEGENWIVSVRKQRLKERGWTGTIDEWQEALELLAKSPLEFEPPITSLEAAKDRAKRR